MALEFLGKLLKVLPEISGQSSKGPWKKQDFVLEETSSQYPKKACFQVWNDKIDLLQRFTLGDELKVSFNIESREYNDKWYTELRVWKIEGNASGKQRPSDAYENTPDISTFKSANDADDNLPF